MLTSIPQQSYDTAQALLLQWEEVKITSVTPYGGRADQI